MQSRDIQPLLQGVRGLREDRAEGSGWGPRTGRASGAERTLGLSSEAGDSHVRGALWEQGRLFKDGGCDPGQEGRMCCEGGREATRQVCCCECPGPPKFPHGQNTETPGWLALGVNRGTQEHLRGRGKRKLTPPFFILYDLEGKVKHQTLERFLNAELEHFQQQYFQTLNENFSMCLQISLFYIRLCKQIGYRNLTQNFYRVILIITIA